MGDDVDVGDLCTMGSDSVSELSSLLLNTAACTSTHVVTVCAARCCSSSYVVVVRFELVLCFR